MNRKDAIILVLVLVIVSFLFASTIQYYNTQLGERDSQIASLKSQLAGLQKPDLVTSLGVSEKMSNYTYDANDPKTYNHLLIEGTVTNMGLGTAHNAGLHVDAVSITGEVVINMTVPIVAGSYGLGGNQGPSALYDMANKESGTAQIAIYHKGIVATWNVIPVYDT
jgi:hypothetical protein